MEKPNFQERLVALAQELVTPDRFKGVLSAADLALGDTVAFEPIDLPETARVYAA